MRKRTAASRPAAPTKRAPRAARGARPTKTQKNAPGKAAKKLNAVEAALAAFAHEVRTPLTGILAVSELLATSDLGERERRWVETIKAGAEHLANLATVFVDAARSKSGHEGREDFFDLPALARALGDTLAGRATVKRLERRITIADDLPAFVVGDAVRLRAALENLIDNAVKFTEQGEVTLDVSRTPLPKGRRRGDVAIAFVVSDSGIGLSPEEIRKLFRPFTQASVAIASRFGGAGLGLAFVRQIARAMGGDVTAAPRPGGGTIFTLKVILRCAPLAESRTDGGPATAPSHSARRLRILSVEDNPFGRVVLNAILAELGHQVDFVGRGEDAVDRLAQAEFDAVLMDMVLPGIDGVEAIRRIRSRYPATMVLIAGLSGRGEDEASARAAGADAFLLKPVSPRALAEILARAARRDPPAS